MVCNEGSTSKWFVYYYPIGIDVFVPFFAHICSTLLNHFDIERNIVLCDMCPFYAYVVNDLTSFRTTSSFVFEITNTVLYLAMGTDGGTINNMIEKPRVEGSLWSG